MLHAMMVIEGLKGTPAAEACPARQRSQAPSDQWRDQVLAHAHNAFEGQLRCAPLSRPFFGQNKLG
jgi:hypothetical protein